MVRALPKYVSILGEEVKVRETRKLRSEGEDLHGKFDPNKLEILIDSGSKDKYETTLLHETLHCILELSGFATVIGNKEIEEGMVEVLERNLHKLYKRR